MNYRRFESLPDLDFLLARIVSGDTLVIWLLGPDDAQPHWQSAWVRMVSHLRRMGTRHSDYPCCCRLHPRNLAALRKSRSPIQNAVAPTLAALVGLSAFAPYSLTTTAVATIIVVITVQLTAGEKHERRV